jgi:hypothetical protein
MPGKSKNQVVAARIAEGVKTGTAKANPGSPSAMMAKSMSLPQIQEFSGTPTGKLPKRAKKRAGPAKPKVAPSGMTELPPSPAPAMPPMAKAASAPKATPAGPPMPPVGKRPPIFGQALRKKNAWR